MHQRLLRETRALGAEVRKRHPRLAAMTAAAVAHGLTSEQAEELAHNLAAQLPQAVREACENVVQYRLTNGWLAIEGQAVATLAEALAEAWDRPRNL